MKIAVTMFPLDNLGGIVSNIENQLHGLTELGHDVDFYLLAWQNKFVKPKHTDKEVLKQDGWYQGCFYPAHQMKGWNFPLERKLPYKGSENLAEAKRILSKYDFVIWQIPVPTRQKVNIGNHDWIELYKANKRNVLYSHDAHLINNYPYIYEIKERITGVASTNVASYYGMQLGGVQKALIFSSHKVDNTNEVYNYDKRDKGFLSLQTFKQWKHVEDLVRAIPYMKEKMLKNIAGGGREQNYMVSKDKCRPEYYCQRLYDPDIPEKVVAKKTRIWDYAVEHGMNYLGWITPQKRNSLLYSTRTLIDPSWNLNFAKKGDHFNRVFTDACLTGTIPIGRNYGITTNKEGKGLIFKAGYNYIMIPHDTTPKEFAAIVDEAQNLGRVTWRKMIRRNYQLSKQFCRKHCAQQFINLAFNKPAGYFNDIKILPETNPIIIEKSAKMIKEFFGKERPKIHKEGLRKLLSKRG